MAKDSELREPSDVSQVLFERGNRAMMRNLEFPSHRRLNREKKMGLFPFGRKKEDTQQQAAQEPADAAKLAPGTQIAYNPNMISQLKTEHQQLLELFA
jgi:hypothetical protein